MRNAPPVTHSFKSFPAHQLRLFTFFWRKRNMHYCVYSSRGSTHHKAVFVEANVCCKYSIQDKSGWDILNLRRWLLTHSKIKLCCRWKLWRPQNYLGDGCHKIKQLLFSQEGGDRATSWDHISFSGKAVRTSAVFVVCLGKCGHIFREYRNLNSKAILGGRSTNMQMLRVNSGT